MSDIWARPMQGFLMVPAKNGSPNDGHILCGYQNIDGAVSPNSGRRLLQLAQINTADPRLELQTATFEVLPLLYSWTCDIHQGVFIYHVARGRVDLLDYQWGRTYTDFPYENYPDAFAPQPMALSPIDAKDQHIILRLNDRDSRESSQHQDSFLDRPRHQVGGIPRLMQGAELSPKCPRCADQMPMFAAIANDNGTPQGFTDNPYVQVIYHLCRACWVISGQNICD